jgi:ElaB/YqjD/DUF883 family membrane-anchored ribosome-binding protein
MPAPNASHETAREPLKANRHARSEPESLSEQIDAIRSDIQALTATVGDVAGKQWGQAQTSAQDTIRRNPLAAVAIAAGLGFLYGAFRR